MLSRYLPLFSLIVAGELIFSLPFHIPRYFRPTFLEAFGLTNSDLGDTFAVYGVCAMLAYFPGGLLADRFSARSLITSSLAATALGGFYLLSIPSGRGLAVLFGYWGITTILLFWAAMLRATREWGGEFAQGQAFGLLDGGRGLVAAVMASLAVLLFALVVGDAHDLTSTARLNGMRMVILCYTLATIAAALLCWFALPNSEGSRATKERLRFHSMFNLVLQAMIVACAYCGYKGLDNYSLYAAQVLGMSEVDAARFTAATAYIRVGAAITAGFLADRIGVRNIVVVLFAILGGAYLALGYANPNETHGIIFANLIVTYIAVFALRGVYFALIAESGIDKRSTGTAIGVVSVVGFTPDIFFAPLAGRILDADPGLVGHQNFFLLLSGFASAGLVAAATLAAVIRRQRR
ncbi:MAG: MFS transporter [Pseudomonadota bacterium]